MDSISISDEDVIDGKIDHLYNESITYINCEECTTIKELPNWDNLKIVYFSYCKNIKTIPKWKNVVDIVCCNSGIVEIPNLDNLKFLDCSECVNLTKLPNFDNLEKIDFSFCKHITTIPKWKNIKKITCCYSGVMEIPKLDHIKYIKCEYSENLSKIGYSFTLLYLNCHDCPKLVLSEKFDKNRKLFLRKGPYYQPIDRGQIKYKEVGKNDVVNRAIKKDLEKYLSTYGGESAKVIEIYLVVDVYATNVHKIVDLYINDTEIFYEEEKAEEYCENKYNRTYYPHPSHYADTENEDSMSVASDDYEDSCGTYKISNYKVVKKTIILP
jgi:hypothetical protein